MHMPQYLAITVVTALLFLGGNWPDSLWAEETSPDRTIALYQRLLQRNPFDARAYHRLADAYSRKAREYGDITYFTLAEQALRKALHIDPAYGEARRHLAFVLYSCHDFTGAAQEAEKAIELNPSDAHAYGVLGDAYLEIGKYVQAQEAYQRMIHLQQDLYAYGRLAGLKSLQGDTAGAVTDLKLAIAAGQGHGRPPEHIAWTQWQLGNEHFALGNLGEAEAQYHAALTTYPNYYRALAGLAQIRTAQQRYPEAIELYQQALAIIPLPEYAAALGDVYMKSNRAEEARKQYALVAYIGDLNALNKVLYNRELAYFYADHDLQLEAALALARKELEARQDIHAYDLLAWTLYKTGQQQEALAAMHEALKLGTQDARLFFHAGMIHYRLGHHDDAKTFLQRALTTNPHFHIFHTDVATRLLRQLEQGSDLAARQEHGNEQ